MAAGVGVPETTSHTCLFYRTADDLTEVLVPYFQAGLKEGEFCMWVVSAPLDERQAEEALRQAEPDLDGYLARGQIEIIPCDGWYLTDGSFDGTRVLNGWQAKLDSALSGGWNGMRVAGNMSWAERDDWDDVMQYERSVNAAMSHQPLTAICSYSLDKCDPSDITEATSSHQSTYVKREGAWQLVPGPQVHSMTASETGATKRDIFIVTVTATSGRLKVFIGTDTRTGNYTGRIESEERNASSPTAVIDGVEIRGQTVDKVIMECEKTIRKAAGEILDRGGMPVPRPKKR